MGTFLVKQFSPSEAEENVVLRLFGANLGPFSEITPEEFDSISWESFKARYRISFHRYKRFIARNEEIRKIIRTEPDFRVTEFFYNSYSHSIWESEWKFWKSKNCYSYCRDERRTWERWDKESERPLPFGDQIAFPFLINEENAFYLNELVFDTHACDAMPCNSIPDLEFHNLTGTRPYGDCDCEKVLDWLNSHVPKRTNIISYDGAINLGTRNGFPRWLDLAEHVYPCHAKRIKAGIIVEKLEAQGKARKRIRNLHRQAIRSRAFEFQALHAATTLKTNKNEPSKKRRS